MKKIQKTPNSNTIHGIFECISKTSPEHIAVVWSGQRITYQELNERANFLAKHLVSIGVKKSDVIALEVKRSFELVVSMLAILKCGAVYLPIDENNPLSRNKYCLDLVKAKAIISDKHDKELYGASVAIISSDRLNHFSGRLKNFRGFSTGSEDPAYIMFTSGSSGMPKAVLVPHRAVTRLVINTNYINILHTDNILQFAPVSFDASTFEIWGALLNNATLVLYSGSVLDPNLLKNDIVNYGVTILWLTAALFHLIANSFIDALRPLRILLAGGDVLNAKLINKTLENIPEISVINGYGPTENTTFTCCHVMTTKNKPKSNVPIGKPITGTKIHILDGFLKPINKGEIGELYASGEGVALGYLGEDAGDAFFLNPSIADGLIYRTGDLARINSLNEVEFIGRRDNQVKVRGYRISLEEITTNIISLEGVSDAFVYCKKSDLGDQLLVACVQIDQYASTSEVEMKKKLSSNLPSYMLPDMFKFFSSLPKNKNGKINYDVIKT